MIKLILLVTILLSIFNYANSTEEPTEITSTALTEDGETANPTISNGDTDADLLNTEESRWGRRRWGGGWGRGYGGGWGGGYGGGWGGGYGGGYGGGWGGGYGRGWGGGYGRRGGWGRRRGGWHG